jgi:hypothetical protein
MFPWAIAFVDHLARCGGDASVLTAHSWLVTTLAEIISEVRGALGVDVEILTDPTMLVQLPDGNESGLPPRGCGRIVLSRHPRLKTCS